MYYEDGFWFMSVLIPREGTFVDQYGNPYSDGDTVLITMDIDPVYFHVEFSPHGSTFQGKFPAVIQYSLTYADVEEEALSGLSVYYRPEAGNAWTALPTEWKWKSYWVEAPIDHFSGYAVAW